MLIIARMIHVLAGVYALGLIVYSILAFFKEPGAVSARVWLARFYEPLLGPIRNVVKPVMLHGKPVDLSSLILLIGIYLLRTILIHILLPGF